MRSNNILDAKKHELAVHIVSLLKKNMFSLKFKKKNAFLKLNKNQKLKYVFFYTFIYPKVTVIFKSVNFGNTK